MKNYFRFSFFSLVTLLAAVPASAQEAATKAGGGFFAIGAGIAVGLAAMGGALGQGRAIGSALDGIGRNPAADKKIFTPMLVGLAFVESLVIFAWLIAFFLYQKA
jgi:F-type H+-transporting ATPase subunit c